MDLHCYSSLCIYYMMMMMIFIYCNWVSTRWQWSVTCTKIGHRQHKRRNNTQNNTKTQNTQNRKHTKQENKYKKIILKNISQVCGNKMPTTCNRGFYCRSYCLLNMFRAPLCPSSGAQEYYTVVAACGISCCGFQVACLVWS